jgi:hypothetical protein
LPVYVDVVPSLAHVDERLLDAAARETSAIAPGTLSFDALVALLHARFLPGVRAAPPLVERMALEAGLRRRASEGGTQRHDGVLPVLARAVDTVLHSGVSAQDLARSAAEVPAEDALRGRRPLDLRDQPDALVPRRAQRGLEVARGGEAPAGRHQVTPRPLRPERSHLAALVGDDLIQDAHAASSRRGARGCAPP